MNTPQQRPTPFPQALCDRGPVQHDRHHHRVVRLFPVRHCRRADFQQDLFPAIDPITGTLAAFGTYAVGFVARPLGGIVFGHFGDRVGRKSMLMISLMLMGVPTVLIGLTPSYESIGYWGAVALVFCRFLQGLAVGGEWGGRC